MWNQKVNSMAKAYLIQTDALVRYFISVLRSLYATSFMHSCTIFYSWHGFHLSKSWSQKAWKSTCYKRLSAPMMWESASDTMAWKWPVSV